jgi:hypothetical protein
VVCFGASAGGFKAYCTILSLLPADTGLAFIIVHHQPADGKSLLIELLPRFTEMPVVLLADGEIVTVTFGLAGAAAKPQGHIAFPEAGMGYGSSARVK